MHPAPTTEHAASPVHQIPPAETVRRRLADLAWERSLLRQLLRLAIRQEQGTTTQTGGGHAA